MVFERPKPRKQSDNSSPKSSNPALQRSVPNNSGGGNRGGDNQGGNRGDGNPPPNKSGGNNQPPLPSCWLLGEEPPINNTAGFPEYLRWMREINPDDKTYRDPTKLQILQKAEEKPNYQKRLEILNKRTKLIAGEKNCFQVKSSWRVRVGGHRGPESILLPAFDNLGIPFIPASTLRGVARTQAIREAMIENKCGWKEAENKIERWFGGLKAGKADQAGKVVFLDAYPIPGQVGLMVDMANNIWQWKNDKLDYDPNPNSFLSLKEPTFLIGVKLIDGCQDEKILDQVKTWLKQGLQTGIGSQVNTGYGEFSLVGEGKPKSTNEFFRVEFLLEGQLIHGRQKFTPWKWNDPKQEYQMRGQSDAEVRPTAFKSMLRYWFRAFGLGVLPVTRVKTLESEIFGGINLPKSKWGYLQVNILDGEVLQNEPIYNDDPYGQQAGILTLGLSANTPVDKKDSVKNLLKNLTWLMFHLGGVGQGARRPGYSRKNRQRAPWYRGENLRVDSDDDFWNLPDAPADFSRLFNQRLKSFYQSLCQIVDQQDIRPLDRPLPVIRPTNQDWEQAIDQHCQIVVCQGDEDFNKPYALAILHHDDFKVERKNNQKDYNCNLCGKAGKASPVWIADLGNYQVVTVFGATVEPRNQYLEKLEKKAKKYCPLWPINK
jgi:CRISPR-associated protein Cmr6